MDIRIHHLIWIEREEWDAMRAMCVDLWTDFRDYEAWLLAAEKGLKLGDKTGARVVKVNIDAAGFRAFCTRANVPPNSKARSAFAHELANKRRQN
jgi:hypothetical protein